MPALLTRTEPWSSSKISMVSGVLEASAVEDGVPSPTAFAAATLAAVIGVSGTYSPNAMSAPARSSVSSKERTPPAENS